MSNGSPITQALDSNGQAIFTLSGLDAGTYNLSASYVQQGNFLASSNTGSLTVSPTTLTVTSTADDGSVGTLGYAISQANTGNYNEIDFAIGTSGSSQTINLTSALPTLTASGVSINGLSQNVSGKAFQLITLNGTGAGASDGLLLQGSNGTVSGLILENFGDNGIEVEGVNNAIGGSVKGAGNVLSGNGQDGLLLDSTASGTTVQGNYIGLNTSASVVLANGSNGLDIQGTNNTIGGTASGTRNLISGNGNDGVMLGGSGNLVVGDDIGIDAAGSGGLGNSGNGIEIAGNSNAIGGTTSTMRNVNSSNTKDGVLLDSGASGNRVSVVLYGIGMSQAPHV